VVLVQLSVGCVRACVTFEWDDLICMPGSPWHCRLYWHSKVLAIGRSSWSQEENCCWAVAATWSECGLLGTVVFPPVHHIRAPSQNGLYRRTLFFTPNILAKFRRIVLYRAIKYRWLWEIRDFLPIAGYKIRTYYCHGTLIGSYNGSDIIYFCAIALL